MRCSRAIRCFRLRGASFFSAPPPWGGMGGGPPAGRGASTPGDGAARWQEGHLPGPEDRTPARRLGRLVGEVIVHDLYGISIAAGLIALVLSALLRSRFGSEGLLAPMIWLIAVSMIVWLFFTHLVDRFAIVLVPPCCVLAGVAAVGVSGRGVALGRVIIGAFVVVNGFLLVRVCNE